MQWLYKLENSLAHSFWLLPPDVHERQRWIKNHLPKNQKILDLGGEERHLEKLTQASQFVTLNVDNTVAHNEIKQKDQAMYYDGTTIPFKKNSFDYVVCIDVLEHVPQSKRLQLIEQMVKIATKQVVISAPYGTRGHIEHEKKLLAELAKQNINVQFLQEHISIGLPSPEEIATWENGFKGRLALTGNYIFSGWLLKLSLLKASNPLSNHLLFLSRLITNLVINLLVGKLIDILSPMRRKNRFYIVIDS